jgi:hypothetical protein
MGRLAEAFLRTKALLRQRKLTPGRLKKILQYKMRSLHVQRGLYLVRALLVF